MSFSKTLGWIFQPSVLRVCPECVGRHARRDAQVLLPGASVAFDVEGAWQDPPMRQGLSGRHDMEMPPGSGYRRTCLRFSVPDTRGISWRQCEHSPAECQLTAVVASAPSEAMAGVGRGGRRNGAITAITAAAMAKPMKTGR